MRYRSERMASVVIDNLKFDWKYRAHILCRHHEKSSTSIDYCKTTGNKMNLQMGNSLPLIIRKEPPTVDYGTDITYITG